MDAARNDFQYKVIDFFQSRNWGVTISPYYVDLITQKSREIDIIAEKTFTVLDNFHKRRANLLVRLFVECKYFADYVSLHVIFIPKDRNLAEKLASNNILRNRGYPFFEDVSVDSPKSHHYVQGSEVAKSAICLDRKGGNSDIFYKAYEQAIHALIYFRNQTPRQRFAPIDKEFGPDPTYIIDYPLVVVNSFETFFKRDWASAKEEKITDNFIFYHDYSYTIFNRQGQHFPRREDFFIDIISLPTLDTFLVNLEQTDLRLLKGRTYVDLMK